MKMTMWNDKEWNWNGVKYAFFDDQFTWRLMVIHDKILVYLAGDKGQILDEKEDWKLEI